jgi:8-hydroxy-5-deazaflavin:NADPH oxidoreductase
MDVTIIGAGKMARGISTRLLEGGNQVTLVGHTPEKADALAVELKRIGKGKVEAIHDGQLKGEVVILAVPYSAMASILQAYKNQLAGKIVVDITNPINYQTMESLVPGSSAAEEIAKQLPGSAHVIKAFNTTFAGTLLDHMVTGMPLDVFLAGDDAEAKLELIKMIEAGGMRAIDTGPLARARQLEALGLLHIALQSQLNTGYMSAIKILH